MNGIPMIAAVMFYVAPTDDGWRLEHYPTDAGEAVVSPVSEAVEALAARKPIAVRAADADAVRAAWVGERVTA